MFGDSQKGRRPGAPTGTSGIGALTAFIDQGSEFSGKLSFRDTVRIDGRFEGEISSENTLIVGESGSVHAKVSSGVVLISGEVEGDVVAREQVVLHKTARVAGTLETPRLVIEDGARFDGQVKMGGAASDAKKTPAS